MGEQEAEQQVHFFAWENAAVEKRLENTCLILETGQKGTCPLAWLLGHLVVVFSRLFMRFLLHFCGRRVKRLLVELGAGQGVEGHVFDIRNPFSGLFLSLRCPLSAFHAFWRAFPAKPLCFHRPVQFSEQNSDARKKYHSHF